MKKKKVVAKKIVKTTKAKKPKVKSKKKLATNGVIKIAEGVNIVRTKDGNYKLSGKNVKGKLKKAIVKKIEHEHHFDERLIPYHLGGKDKESNLLIREHLIKLGKTEDMVALYRIMKENDFAYQGNAKKMFSDALYNLICGDDEIALNHVSESDRQIIHENNKKKFEEFFAPADEEDYS